MKEKILTIKLLHKNRLDLKEKPIQRWKKVIRMPRNAMTSEFAWIEKCYCLSVLTGGRKI